MPLTIILIFQINPWKFYKLCKNQQRKLETTTFRNILCLKLSSTVIAKSAEKAFQLYLRKTGFCYVKVIYMYEFQFQSLQYVFFFLYF